MAHAATGGLRSPRTLAPFFPAAFASAFRASVNSSSGSWYRRSISTSKGGTPFIILDKEQWAIVENRVESSLAELGDSDRHTTREIPARQRLGCQSPAPTRYHR